MHHRCHFLTLFFSQTTFLTSDREGLFLLIFDSPCLTGYQHIVDSQEGVNNDLVSPLPSFSCPFIESPQSSECLKCAASCLGGCFTSAWGLLTSFLRPFSHLSSSSSGGSTSAGRLSSPRGGNSSRPWAILALPVSAPLSPHLPPHLSTEAVALSLVNKPRDLAQGSWLGVTSAVGSDDGGSGVGWPGVPPGRPPFSFSGHY